MKEYTIDDIQSLSFKEGVRKRIQMYLGSDDNDGTYQALKEIINNSTDEAIAGYGKKIRITVNEKTNTVSVRDYGRGVPFGIRENNENVLVSIYTRSHTGGKFNDDVYKSASGLNGIGSSCTCLSSDNFKVESNRDGTKATAIFKKGDLVSYDEKTTKDKNGTLVRFNPDPEVFNGEKIGYSLERIKKDIKDISYLYSGLTFEIVDETTGKKWDYYAKNGIRDFIKDNISEPFHKTIMHKILTDENGDTIEIAFQWGSKREKPYVFVNGLRCPELGTPATGAKQAITRTFNSLAGTKFSGDLIRNNLFYVMNCSVAHPSFANQTKSKINNASLRSLSSGAFSESLKEMEIRHKEEFQTILELLEKVSRAEKAAEKARQQVLSMEKEIQKNKKRKVFASDKLKDAEFLGQDSTLLLCEGDSSLNGMALARDHEKYGLLAVKGKMINALANPPEKIYENEEVKLLLSALGVVPGKYNANNLRYGRLGIASDADSDGAHVALLAITVLQYLIPEFIRENRLFWLRSPLYVVFNKRKNHYYYNDKEFEQRPKNISGKISRMKGLGSLDPEIARDSMFNMENQRLEHIKYSDEGIDLLYDLMGENIQPRKDFVMKNIDFSVIKE